MAAVPYEKVSFTNETLTTNKQWGSQTIVPGKFVSQAVTPGTFTEETLTTGGE